jgi:hypothetical protein
MTFTVVAMIFSLAVPAGLVALVFYVRTSTMNNR